MRRGLASAFAVGRIAPGQSRPCVEASVPFFLHPPHGREGARHYAVSRHETINGPRIDLYKPVPDLRTVERKTTIVASNCFGTFGQQWCIQLNIGLDLAVQEGSARF
jgi:hypothetical protein